MKKINVISVFDGLGGALEALKRSKIPVDKYFAFEIDRYAIKIAEKNHPEIIHLGDVKNWKFFDRLPKIDLLVAGFPCQSYSIAGKRLALDDVRGKLLYDLLEMIDFYRPTDLLLENVKGLLSAQKGQVVELILSELSRMGYVINYDAVNSALVSAQNRERVYFTTWKFEQPKDRGIVLADILEDGYTDRDKSYCIDANYWKGGNYKSYFGKGRRQLVFNEPVQVGVANLNRHDILKRVYAPDAKSPTLNSMGGGNREPKIDLDGKTWRMLTPIEIERLQNLEDNYTFGVSNTQRKKMLGNGFNIETVAHILKYYKEKINE